MANPFARWLLGSEERDRQKRIDALLAENADLRREIAESRWLMGQWQEEVKTARAGFGNHIDDAVASKLAYLFHELADPLVDLLEQRRRAVDAGPEGAPLVRFADELLSSMEKFGLRPLGEPGSTVAFDDALHDIDAPEVDRPGSGAPVVLLGYGLLFRDRVIRRAAARVL